jgi:NCAIR mutase (PurE)-related protein
VVLAAGKTPQQIELAAGELLRVNGRVLISRIASEQRAQLAAAFPDAILTAPAGSHTALLHFPGSKAPRTGGRLAVITAGTSDLPAAHEARMVAEEMGCEVTLIADVGVAGLHRLFAPLRQVLDEGVHAIVVAAGMDGALPSVVSGLVPVPVIGLPTSTGYGFGGQGEAALMSMLQTCAPGLVVVNIDNGVGAGATAALMANRVAAARRS